MKIDSLFAGARLYRKRTGQPMVTLSYAQSLDGSIAAHRGVPLSLSGRESLRLWHRLRVCHDAILVGIGTVLTDDPQLNVRLVTGNDPRPIILDTRLRFPLKALALNSGKPPWIITAAKSDREKKKELESRGAEVIRLKTTSKGRIDLPCLLKYLAQREINSVMVEGGARVITSFLRAQQANYFVLTITPFFVGGLHAVEQLITNKKMGRNIRLNRTKIIGSRWYGRDLVIWGEFQ